MEQSSFSHGIVVHDRRSLTSVNINAKNCLIKVLHKGIDSAGPLNSLADASISSSQWHHSYEEHLICAAANKDENMIVGVALARPLLADFTILSASS